MRVELESAAEFIISMLRAGHRSKMVRSKGHKFFLEPEIEMLQLSLLAVMKLQYKDFWFPESPNRGSAYRCIRINKGKMDPVIARAADACGLSCHLIQKYLPVELTVWVDPAEVSYRIGEEDGSICVLYEGPLQPPHDAVIVQPGRPSSSSVSTSPRSISSSSPPFNNSHNRITHFQMQQQQHHRQQQKRQKLQQQQKIQQANGMVGSYNSFTSTPAKSQNVIWFMPPTYGFPVQFVHLTLYYPYQLYPAFFPVKFGYNVFSPIQKNCLFDVYFSDLRMKRKKMKKNKK